MEYEPFEKINRWILGVVLALVAMRAVAGGSDCEPISVG
jgi:hypothetical protein